MEKQNDAVMSSKEKQNGDQTFSMYEYEELEQKLNDILADLKKDSCIQQAAILQLEDLLPANICKETEKHFFKVIHQVSNTLIVHPSLAAAAKYLPFYMETFFDCFSRHHGIFLKKWIAAFKQLAQDPKRLNEQMVAILVGPRPNAEQIVNRQVMENTALVATTVTRTRKRRRMNISSPNKMQKEQEQPRRTEVAESSDRNILPSIAKHISRDAWSLSQNSQPQQQQQLPQQKSQQQLPQQQLPQSQSQQLPQQQSQQQLPQQKSQQQLPQQQPQLPRQQLQPQQQQLPQQQLPQSQSQQSQQLPQQQLPKKSQQQLPQQQPQLPQQKSQPQQQQLPQQQSQQQLPQQQLLQPQQQLAQQQSSQQQLPQQSQQQQQQGKMEEKNKQTPCYEHEIYPRLRNFKFMMNKDSNKLLKVVPKKDYPYARASDLVIPSTKLAKHETNLKFKLSKTQFAQLQEKKNVKLMLGLYHEENSCCSFDLCDLPSCFSMVKLNSNILNVFCIADDEKLDGASGSNTSLMRNKSSIYKNHKLEIVTILLGNDISRGAKLGDNVLIIESKCECDFTKFSVSLCLVTMYSVDELVTKKKSHSLLQYKDALNAILNSFKNNDTDGELSITSSKFCLKDSITHKKIECPVRGLHCPHVQCFDLRSYLEFNAIVATFHCPICHKLTPYQDLIVDMYFQAILDNEKVHGKSDATEVVINSDGSFELVLAHRQHAVLHNVIDDNDIILCE